jgi:hypothetical protein
MAIGEFNGVVIGPAESESEPSEKLLPAPVGGWLPSRRSASFSHKSVFSFAIQLGTQEPETSKACLLARVWDTPARF